MATLKLPLHPKIMESNLTSVREIPQIDHVSSTVELINKNINARGQEPQNVAALAGGTPVCCDQRSVHNMKHSAKERERLVRNLSSSLEKREKYQSAIE